MSGKTHATRPKRTVRTVVCVAGAIVAAVASVSAWYWHSRLNPVEIQLLGEWSLTRSDGSLCFLHYRPDRTFRYWTSTGNTEQPGTWKVSRDELVLTFRNIDHGTPKSAWSLFGNEVDRLRNPAAWADYAATFTLEDVSSSALRLRDPRDNSKIVYRRVDSTGQTVPPR